MTGALEEYVTSYGKYAHGCITAIDTRLSNGSTICKKEKKTDVNKKTPQSTLTRHIAKTNNLITLNIGHIFCLPFMHSEMLKWNY